MDRAAPNAKVAVTPAGGLDAAAAASEPMFCAPHRAGPGTCQT
ncbi:hypothetical protein ACUY2K_04925 [Corynebacterium macginleyi]